MTATSDAIEFGDNRKGKKMARLQVVRALVVGAALCVSGVAMAGPTGQAAPVKKEAKAGTKDAAKAPTKSAKKVKHAKHARKAKAKAAKKPAAAPAK